MLFLGHMNKKYKSTPEDLHTRCVYRREQMSATDACCDSQNLLHACQDVLKTEAKTFGETAGLVTQSSLYRSLEFGRQKSNGYIRLYEDLPI